MSPGRQSRPGEGAASVSVDGDRTSLAGGGDVSPAMSARERSDLQQLARMNARVAKADVEALVAQRLAEFEHELARDWSAQELQVEALLTEADAKVAQVNARVQQRCDELGIRPELRPRMVSRFVAHPRAGRDREIELRRIAKADLEAAGRRAKTEIDRRTANICGQVLAAGIGSDEARSFLAQVPSVESLVPVLDVAELEQRALGGAR